MPLQQSYLRFDTSGRVCCGSLRTLQCFHVSGPVPYCWEEEAEATDFEETDGDCEYIEDPRDTIANLLLHSPTHHKHTLANLRDAAERCGQGAMDHWLYMLYHRSG